MRKNQSRATGVILIGLAVTGVATLLMNFSEGFDGLLFMPFAFFIGPVIALSGLVFGFTDRKTNTKEQNRTFLYVVLGVIGLPLCLYLLYLLADTL